MKILPAFILLVSILVIAQGLVSKNRFKKLSPVKRELTRRELQNLKPKIDGTPRGKTPPHSLSGNLKPAIIGGQSAEVNKFPWMVALSIDSAWFCGGSVISATFVLTAGHCVFQASNFFLIMGSVAWKDAVKRVTFTSTKGILHAKYDNIKLFNDIALIQLNTPIPDNVIRQGRIVPIRLPSQTQAKKEVFVRSVATVSGWGMTNDTSNVSDNLNFVDLEIITNAACAQSYGKGEVVSSMLCTSGANGKNICSGDSGSALHVAEADGLRTQIGVVSFGNDLSCIGKPSGFTRVSSFLAWISKHTNLIIRK